MSKIPEELSVDQIKKLIPHRAPMLLIDKVKNIFPGEEATGIKAVSGNEPYFQGHFPNYPVMPGVLIVEAIAQTASVMVAYSDPEFTKGKLVFFTTIENARFRQPVRPGDVLELKIVKKGSKGPLWKFTGTANVEAKVVANCEFGAMIVDPDR